VWFLSALPAFLVRLTSSGQGGRRGDTVVVICSIYGRPMPVAILLTSALSGVSNYLVFVELASVAEEDDADAAVRLG